MGSKCTCPVHGEKVQTIFRKKALMKSHDGHTSTVCQARSNDVSWLFCSSIKCSFQGGQEGACTAGRLSHNNSPRKNLKEDESSKVGLSCCCFLGMECVLSFGCEMI